MTKVTTPVKGFTGQVLGVHFTDGKGETDDPTALGYFRRKGYTVAGETIERTEHSIPDARDVGFLGSGIEPQGTRLRDAAVDPRPEDFLPPSNAGEADPHGPEVVSPGLHAVEGAKPVTPGKVPDEPDAQEAKETAATGNAERPAKSAAKGDWVAYAVAQGLPDAGVLTKAELIELYGEDA